jgi:hypothetical protein
MLTCDFISAGLHELCFEAVDDALICHKAITRWNGVSDLSSALRRHSSSRAAAGAGHKANLA